MCRGAVPTTRFGPARRDRNVKEEVPYEPTPTEHELLLFTPCPRAVAVLASYPRSGNTLMRTMYEHTTLRVTGSDMQGGLAKHGESLLASSVHLSPTSFY